MKSKIACLFLLFAAPLLHGQATPTLMSYQGRVTDAAGVLIGNTAPVNRTVTFKLYTTSSGGAPIYAETQAVTISGGEFSVLIGNGTGVSGSPGPSSPATTPYKTLATVINSNTYTNLYLGITVDDGTAAVDPEISPRQQMVSGAFALRAKVAESVAGSAITTSMLGDAQVSTGKIAAGAVDSSRIASQTIVANNIANSTITSTKLDATSIGIWTPVGSSVYRTGYVGIGEANPGFPLNFESTVGDKISLYGRSGANFGFGIQTSLLQIYTPASAHDVAFGYGRSAAMTETMRVKGNGNVGIGTSAPAEKLVVAGTAQADRLYSNGVVRARGGNYGANGTNTGFSFDGNGDSDGGMFSGGDGILQLYTNSTERLRLTGNGNMGLGTTNPSEKLSIQDGKLWFTTASGNGDTGGIGGTMAANDFYRIYGAGDNDDGALYIDTYDGAVEPIIFRQVAGQPGGSITPFERMRIHSNGYVGIGVASPDERLQVAGPIRMNGTNSNGSASYASIAFTNNGTTINTYNSLHAAGNWRTALFDGDSNWDFSSDERLKTQIVDSEPMLDRLMQLPFRRFLWKDNAGPDITPEFGVIAQEVAPLFPDIVSKAADGTLMVGYTTFATIACKSIQELKVQMDGGSSAVQEQLREKDRKIADLETRLAALEKLIQSGN